MSTDALESKPGTCACCSHWQPTNYDSVTYKDLVAKCPIQGRYFSRHASCSHYSGLQPTEYGKMRQEHEQIIRNLAKYPDETEAQYDITNALENWYEKNRAEFVQEHHVEGDKVEFDKQDGDVEYTPRDEVEADRYRVCLGPSSRGNKLFKHQQEDFHRFKDETEIGLFLEMGCIAEGTFITYGPKKASKRITIESAYSKQLRTSKQQYVRGLRYDDTFGKIPVLNIIQSGIKECLKIVTSSGKSLELTSDHKVLTTEGWVAAGNLTFQHHLVCNGETMSEMSRRNYVRCDWTGSTVIVVPKFEQVVSITLVGKKMTYDIQCLDPHNFVANGIVVHNCGKSAIVCRVAAWKYLKGDIDALLVIAPNEVHTQWAREVIDEWMPSEIPREVQCLFGRGGAKDAVPFRYSEYLQIVCVNVDTFSTPNKWMDVRDWALSRKCFLALDEATCIKNINAKRTDRLLYEFNDVVKRNKTVVSSSVKTVARACLTGTPATNGVIDLWSIMEFLRPNFFGRNWYSFRNRYSMLATILVETPNGDKRATQILLTRELWDGVKRCPDYETAYGRFGVSQDTYETVQMQDSYRGSYKHEEEIKRFMEPVSVFRVLTDCVNMPERTYHRRLVQMSDEQVKCYKSMERELIAMYRGATTTAANKLSAITRLSQISSGFIVQGACGYNPEEFQLSGEEYDLEPGQIQWIGNSVPKLEALYRDVNESNRPTIIITRFSAEASRIYDELSREHSCLLYTGWKKTGTVDEFKEGKYDHMVANIRCVSRGFNLQNSTKMFFYSNTFSLEDRLQTEGRIYRTGQKLPTNYVDYVNKGTVDVKIIGALRQKRALQDYIRGTELTSFLEEEDEITMMEGLLC